MQGGTFSCLTLQGPELKRAKPLGWTWCFLVALPERWTIVPASPTLSEPQQCRHPGSGPAPRRGSCPGAEPERGPRLLAVTFWELKEWVQWYRMSLTSASGRPSALRGAPIRASSCLRAISGCTGQVASSLGPLARKLSAASSGFPRPPVAGRTLSTDEMASGKCSFAPRTLESLICRGPWEVTDLGDVVE